MRVSLLSTELISHAIVAPLPDFGYMGLTRISPTGNAFYGRRLPDNAIVHTHAVLESTGWRLVENGAVITTDLHSTTGDGRKVVGYEDPTFVNADENPFGARENALLCSQTYAVNEQGALGCDLVYCAERPGGEWAIRPMITALELEKLHLADRVEMVKEAEPFFWCGSWHMLYEYLGDGMSCLGYCHIASDGTLEGHRSFYTAMEDDSEHLSTAGKPVFLEDGRILVLFNRRRSNEWGISYMIGTSFDSTDGWLIAEDFIIQAEESHGRGPGDQRIAFASCITEVEPGSIEVLYHINDICCGRAMVALQAG